MEPRDRRLEPVEGTLDEPVPDPRAAEEEIWVDALEGLRARLRERGALPAPPKAPRPPDDEFGLDLPTLVKAKLAGDWLYDHWFRVKSAGHENLPDEGPAIFVSNHGGLLPFDGGMLIIDLLRHRNRLLRSLVDRFVGDVPALQPLFEGMGQVIGTRDNFRALLDAGQWVLVFPEGMNGIRKPFSRRFELEPFHPGFVEEAQRAQVPIIPISMTGPESQAPILTELPEIAAQLGLPAFPVTPTFPLLGPLGLVPLPVQYRIRYGSALPPSELLGLDPEEVAEDVRDQIQSRVDTQRWRSGP